MKGAICASGVVQSMNEFSKRHIVIVPVSKLLSRELTEKNFLP